MKLSEYNKLKIREAIISTCEDRSAFEDEEKTPNFDKIFELKLREKFPPENGAQLVHTSFNNKKEFPLDILIEDCCVIKLKKDGEENNPQNSEITLEIETTVKKFELPGIFVNTKDWKNPLVDWYYYDETECRAKKENNEHEDVMKIYQKNEIQTLKKEIMKKERNRPSDEQTQEQEAPGWSFGTSLLVAGAAALSGMVVFRSLSRRRND
ncbi:UNVERIFIED_CONTAM: hypothetical protein RMT77_002052 [Armadillidium vulgare]